MKASFNTIAGCLNSTLEVERRWKAEAIRRRDEVRSGKVKTAPAAEVYRRIEQLLAK